MGFSISCTTSEIPEWTAEGRIWFTSKDTTSFTFALYPDSASKVIEIPISLAGNLAGNDREIKISIASDFRNDSTKYKILSPTVIPKDSSNGYLKICVYKTANLNNARDTITFAIENSDQLVTGLSSYLKNSLIVYSKFVKPDWWTKTATYTLGRYTEMKLGVVFKVLGTITETPLCSDKAAKALNIYKLNKYCTDNGPFYDYDGELVKFAYGY